MRTLVLNKTHEPLFMISARRAFCLVLLGKAEVLVFSDEVFTTVSSSYTKASVIRILHKRIDYTPKRRKCTRRAVFIRDGYCCCYCNAFLKDRELTWDHVMPKSRGGKKTWRNMVTCCRDCNVTKADRTPEEAGMPLLVEPTIPNLYTIQGLESLAANFELLYEEPK